MTISEAVDTHTFYFVLGFLTCAVMSLIATILLARLCPGEDEPDITDEEEKP